MSEVFLENPPKRRKRRRSRRNSPTLMVFGNPRKTRRSKSKSGGSSMAKRKRRGRKRMPAGLAKYWAKKRRGGGRRRARVSRRRSPRRTSRRRSGGGRTTIKLRRVGRKGTYRTTLPARLIGRGNPVVGGLIRIPTAQELTAVAVGALALPAISKLLKTLPFPEMMKTGWGAVATEMLIGSAASVLARRFVGPAAGDVMFVLTLANGVQKSVVALAPDQAKQFLGLSDNDELADNDLEYYDPGQMSYYSGAGSSLAASYNEEGMPSMV